MWIDYANACMDYAFAVCSGDFSNYTCDYCARERNGYYGGGNFGGGGSSGSWDFYYDCLDCDFFYDYEEGYTAAITGNPMRLGAMLPNVRQPF